MPWVIRVIRVTNWLGSGTAVLHRCDMLWYVVLVLGDQMPVNDNHDDSMMVMKGKRTIGMILGVTRVEIKQHIPNQTPPGFLMLEPSMILQNLTYLSWDQSSAKAFKKPPPKSNPSQIFMLEPSKILQNLKNDKVFRKLRNGRWLQRYQDPLEHQRVRRMKSCHCFVLHWIITPLHSPMSSPCNVSSFFYLHRSIQCTPGIFRC